MYLKTVDILGVRVAVTSKEEVLEIVEQKILHKEKFYIVTPNPELVLMAQNNHSLKVALNGADMAIPDGVGLKLADLSLNIIKGRELFFDSIELLDTKSLKAFFLGGEGDEAEVAAAKLKKQFKKIKIETFRGPILDSGLNPVTEVDKKLEKDAIDKINKFNTDFLFVAFGNPKQETWIHKNLPNLKVKGVMAVGGTLRYVAGYSKLPPKVFSSLGLEWLWRLITEPFRFKRIWNAVVVFPLKVLMHKLKHS